MNFVSEGLNAISDNPGWTPDVRRDHAQGLRLEMDKVEEAAADLIAQANWAVQLLTKNASPYNHEYTCQIRLVKAIGQLERALKGNG
ncbi:MAG: hypothetical protein GHHEDOFH_01557 [Pseudorhodoplanes sp.]|nr:hypothetical protein [Pseudorhodoplanes sp.]